MSTIDSGLNGVLNGQAPAKGKAAQGKTIGASQKGDFASTIASLEGKGEGDGGRKGGRISISATGRNQMQAEQPADARKAGQRDLAALAEALREAGAETASRTARAQDDAGSRKAHGDDHETGKAAVRKGDQSKPRHETVESETEDGSGDVPAKSDVGNLLELLAAPATIAHVAVEDAASQAAETGVAHGVKGQPDGKAAAKTRDQATGKAEAAPSADAADAAGDLPRSDTDQLFRLIRADGKGRDLDMSISGTGEHVGARDADQTAAKIETVTVVDSRRYLGLAQTGNAGAVTTAITQDPGWAASLGTTGGLSHSEAAVTGKVVNTLKIQMHPIELGLVTATLRLQGEELVVSLQVESGEAYRQLSDDKDAIVKALRGHGFAVDQVSVQLSPADRGAGTQQQGDGQAQQQQQQFSSQPQAREGGNGRQGGNGNDTRTFAGEGASHDGSTSENASGLPGGQPVRSGGVYL